MDRDRPAYDPLGIPVGSFVLYPKVELGGEFDSNALATDETKVKSQSDWDYLEQLSLLVASNWNRNSFLAQATANLKQASRFGGNDETGWAAKMLGHYDLVGKSYLEISADASRQYMERVDTGFPVNAADVPSYYDIGADFLARYERDRLRLTGIFDARKYIYGRVADTTGGQIDLRYDSFQAGRLSGRGEYGLSPDFALLVEADYTVIKHPSYGGLFGPPENSTEADIYLGASGDVTHLIRGELDLGFLDRQYQSDKYKAIDGLALNAKLEYFPTQLITVTLTGTRSVVDSIYFNAGVTSPGYLLTAARLRVDYELLRNLIFTASVGRQSEQYEDVSREDQVDKYSGGVILLLNRGVGLQFSIDRYSRHSSGANRYRSFDGNQAFLTLILKR
jgi:hypothetical protein